MLTKEQAFYNERHEFIDEIVRETSNDYNTIDSWEVIKRYIKMQESCLYDNLRYASDSREALRVHQELSLIQAIDTQELAMIRSKDKQRKALHDATIKFEQAYDELVELAMYNTDLFESVAYPFEQSFDELIPYTWLS